MTLIEVLLAGGLMVVILIAVLGTAEMFGSRARATGETAADQDAARTAMARITTELRGAGPNGTTGALLRGLPADVIFLNSGLQEAPGAWRALRYCWDAGGRVHRQVSATLGVSGTSCPDAAWGTDQVLIERITSPPFAVTTRARAQISVGITLDPVAAPPLQSAVALRNRALDPRSVTCTTTGSGTALLGVDLGVGEALAVPLAFADLVGLKALLFAGQAPPATWGCP